MRVTVLGSGSRGNAIAVAARGTAILVDAGFGVRALERRAKAVGLDLGEIAAVVLTHEHGDHARGAAAVARRAACPVWASSGTLRALRARLRGVAGESFPRSGPLRIGPFRVWACRTSHDAAEPVALALEGPAGQRVGVAYDLGRPTPQLRSLLRGATCLLVEANHDDGMLRAGPYPPAVQRRIAGPGGHLSNRAAAELVASVCHAGLRTVVLAHLSGECNRPQLAAAVVRRALRRRRFHGRVVVARQMVPLPPLELTPAAQLVLDALG